MENCIWIYLFAIKLRMKKVNVNAGGALHGMRRSGSQLRRQNISCWSLGLRTERYANAVIAQA